jgi:hypothetical protein
LKLFEKYRESQSQCLKQDLANITAFAQSQLTKQTLQLILFFLHSSVTCPLLFFVLKISIGHFMTRVKRNVRYCDSLIYDLDGQLQQALFSFKLQ